MEYLVKTGEDINSYTEKLQPGDIVLVEPGEYARVFVEVSPIIYRSLEKHKAIVAGFYLETGDYIEIDGFDLPLSNIEMAGSINNFCLFHNNKIHSLASTGIDFSIGKDNVVEDNEICNVGHGVHTSGSTIGTIVRRNIIHNCHLHGLGMVGGTNEKYLNNIIYNCVKSGIHPGSGSPSGGEIRGNLCFNNQMSQFMVSGSNFLIINNTGISRDGSEYKIFSISGSGHVLKNNIGYRKDGINQVLLIPTNAITDYDCWFDPNNPKCISRNYNPMTLSEYQSYGQGLHSISLDPKFVDILNNDYRLQADSPCINAGNDGRNIGYWQGEVQPEPSPEPEEDKVWNITGVDFVATEQKGSISGTIKKSDGSPCAAIIVDLSGVITAEVVTGQDGIYLFPNLPAGDYVVTPRIDGYVFEPISKVVRIGG